MTGSCPCQPFSVAGKGKGLEDDRHLWPEWHRIITKCLPPVIFGEQVSSPDGLAWLDIVSADLERTGYTVAAFDLCAAGVGAPHIRQRLYFMAYAAGERFNRIHALLRDYSRQNLTEIARRRYFGRMVDTYRNGGRSEHSEVSRTESRSRNQSDDNRSRDASPTSGVGYSHYTGLEGWGLQPSGCPDQWAIRAPSVCQPVPSADFGAVPIGYSASPNPEKKRRNGARLNPEHSRWLMGIPAEWSKFAPTVMQSTGR